MNGDKNQQCEKNEQLITWNVVGPKGDKGDTGATGLQGAQGPIGDTGATGATGLKGSKGTLVQPVLGSIRLLQEVENRDMDHLYNKPNRQSNRLRI
jgi:hypothetical protein